MIAVFVIYVVWDLLNYRLGIRPYGPWPSMFCLALCGLGLIPATYAGTTHAGVVILTDLYLFWIVFLFRAVKRLQKWNLGADPNRSTIRVRGTRGDVKMWVVICGGLTIVFFVLALLCGWPARSS